MDKKTLKSLIIQNRLDGKTFNEISDILDKEYSVKMSRQAVNSMYKRATDANDSINMSIVDVCKYYSLGLNINTIKDMLDKDNIKISLAKIKEIISNNSDYIDEINADNLNYVEYGLRNEYEISEIISLIQYKTIKPTSKKLDYLIYMASNTMINNEVAIILNKLMGITHDKQLINNLIKDFKINLTLKDIRESVGE